MENFLKAMPIFLGVFVLGLFVRRLIDWLYFKTSIGKYQLMFLCTIEFHEIQAPPVNIWYVQPTGKVFAEIVGSNQFIPIQHPKNPIDWLYKYFKGKGEK